MSVFVNSCSLVMVPGWIWTSRIYVFFFFFYSIYVFLTWLLFGGWLPAIRHLYLWPGFFFLIFNLLIITMKAGDLKVDFFVGNIVIYFTKLLTYYFTIYYNKKLLLIIVLESRFDFGVQNLYKLCMCMKHNIFFVCIYIYI